MALDYQILIRLYITPLDETAEGFLLIIVHSFGLLDEGIDYR